MRTVIGAICVFASSLHAATLAYVDSRDRLVYQPEGGKPVVVDRNGYEPSLRRDGRPLMPRIVRNGFAPCHQSLNRNRVGDIRI